MNAVFSAFQPIVASAGAVDRLPYRDFLERKVRMFDLMGLEDEVAA